MAAANYADNATNRYRYYVFTLNNYDETDIMKLKLYANEKCRYITFGKEVGANGTPHLQGYMQLKIGTAGKTIKNQSKCMRIWLHPCKGSGTEARDYCLKQDKEAYQWGDFMDHPPMDKAGTRNTAGAKATKEKWVEIRDDILNGFTEKEMFVKHTGTYIHHSAGINRAITVVNAVPPRKSKTCVHVIIGSPGVGKTTKAVALGGEDAFMYSSPNKIWWSGYDGKSAVIFDDFHGNYPFEEWKKLTDKYSHRVPVHNGMINFNPSLLVITSNLHPTNWWKPEVLGTHGLAALYRRINVLDIWNDETKQFDTFTVMDDGNTRQMWIDGCVCDPVFPESQLAGSQDSTVEVVSESEQDQMPTLDVAEVSPPKKRKVVLRGKSIASALFPQIPVDDIDSFSSDDTSDVSVSDDSDSDSEDFQEIL